MTTTVSRCAIAVSLLVSLSVNAQAVIPARMTGQPLQYMREGSLVGCGLRVVAVTVNDDLTSDASEVSVNIDDNGNALFKAVAYAKFAPGKPAPRPIKVEAAWARAPGSLATRAIGQSYAGDDKLSLLYPTELASALAVLKAQLDGTPVQLSVQRTGQPNYKILAGAVALTEPEQAQLRNCVSELVGAMQRKLELGAASAPK
jgi:hypothetical protein